MKVVALCPELTPTIVARNDVPCAPVVTVRNCATVPLWPQLSD